MSETFDSEDKTPTHSPTLPGSPRPFLMPSPLPTRRTRTYSASERASHGPIRHGVVKSFCRQKGHGFVKPNDGGEPLFIHISDIDGEFVPHEDDEVSYKLCAIPPRNEKFQAVHVKIIHLAPGVKHECWDAPVQMNSPKISPRS